ncbi:hypothetical protein FLM48_04675 [Shewanella sp. Scap07]|uniref:hypothetical protein n=1 Tax=Shewanella sp. Scap07 TaxID=2589987 RepID=UPI0015BE1536|nr:hypothetical protein [Shewanella sp. Scap07]QLE84443.1 hypothetical protein FLM48_04675 [Shewanella sp. Scap07]
MLNAKKALKKLKKSAKKANKQSLKQLKGLHKRVTELESVNDELRVELSQLSQQALKSAVNELKTPFSPVLSWFDDGEVVAKETTKTKQKLAPVTRLKPAVANKDITHFPFKSPPCKKCPARQGGQCKCALKKLAM